ncbi:OsmC family protein [Wenyingzhuangia sp. 2_MG-2023]|uniref:OsmC family protein n=1 Tax=Wenyingzhuangia sp. 2_MG-2023 TaxID=3062639 RepID=UPI0026E47C24|nr:OsmC family protein [Wenyingzhuangia sp. 2_MG-2023]MDO6738492.1 OsmC family protein [Wenyingzhuangia sp. 2_MG-2023]
MSNLKIHLKQCSKSAMELENNKLKIIIDRPIENGGEGKGILGGEYLLTGIGGCYSSNLFAAAQSRNINIEGLALEITATISQDIPKRFSKIDIAVSYESCSDEQVFDKLMAIAERACISVNTVKNGLILNTNKK